MTPVASEPKASRYDEIPFDNILKCVHCGLCLDACPTYRQLGVEQDSPRGRLYLMRGLWEGELELTQEIVEPLSRCLDCRACETACPSAVPYGELLEKTRGVIHEHTSRSFKERFLRWFFFKLSLPSTMMLQWLSLMGLIYRGLGLHLVLKRTPGLIGRGQQLMPAFSGRSFKQKNRGVTQPIGERRGTVALFTGCIMDVAEANIHEATLLLLRYFGFEVWIPTQQTCCGALHVHNGERKIAQKLAQKNQKAFNRDVDAIVINSGGCGAQLREYQHLFNEPGNMNWYFFEEKTLDILDFLHRAGVPDSVSWDEKPITVLYDAPCHMIHAQKIDTGPRTLLASIPGVRLIPLKDASRCCGAAGIYNLVHQGLSDDILDHKLDDIAQSLAEHPEASCLLTGNPGCLFQIRKGVIQRSLPIEVMHPAVFLANRITKKARG